jgi:hypothetical protein
MTNFLAWLKSNWWMVAVGTYLVGAIVTTLIFHANGLSHPLLHGLLWPVPAIRACFGHKFT